MISIFWEKITDLPILWTIVISSVSSVYLWRPFAVYSMCVLLAVANYAHAARAPILDVMGKNMITLAPD